MSNVEQFRQLMAEQGKELTPEEAERIYKMARRIIKFGRSMSQMDLYQLEKTSGYTTEQKKEIIELYQYVRELF